MEQRKMGEEKKVKNEWVHFRELRARCPVCKKVAHVACKNGTYFFVHDAYDPFARHNAVETTEQVFKILFDGFVSVNGREPVKSGNRALTNEAMMQDMFPCSGIATVLVSCNQPARANSSSLLRWHRTIRERTSFFSVPMITCISTRWRTFPISLPDSLRRICNL